MGNRFQLDDNMRRRDAVEAALKYWDAFYQTNNEYNRNAAGMAPARCHRKFVPRLKWFLKFSKQDPVLKLVQKSERCRGWLDTAVSGSDNLPQLLEFLKACGNGKTFQSF